MQYYLSFHVLQERVLKLGMSCQKVARLSNLAVSTITRVFCNKDGSTRSLRKISRALVAYELELLRHLIALHPLEASQIVNDREVNQQFAVNGSREDAA